MEDSLGHALRTGGIDHHRGVMQPRLIPAFQIFPFPDDPLIQCLINHQGAVGIFFDEIHPFIRIAGLQRNKSRAGFEDAKEKSCCRAFLSVVKLLMENTRMARNTYPNDAED